LDSAPSAPLSVSVTRELVERVVRGRYEPGTPIPTEARLGEEFGVSRSVIRESVKAVEDRGLVRIERGRGTIVEPTTGWRRLDPLVLEAQLSFGDRGAVMRELIFFRKALEPEVAAIVASNASDIVVARLGSCVDALVGAAGDAEAYLTADGQFHRTLIDLAGMAIVREIFELIDEPVGVTRELTVGLPEVLRIAHAQHLEVFGAIRAGDPDRARRAMREHMVWNENRLDQVL
jgi:DNA-binding FadR family transcriptional regulator